MPLHDWAETSGWEGLHQYWVTALGRHLRERLPPGYLAVLGTGPAMLIGGPPLKPDVSVRHHPSEVPAESVPAGAASPLEPDGELVAVSTMEAVPTLLIERERRLVAVVEVVSPRNKVRPSSRASTAARYAGYLLDGVHLMLIDLLPHPRDFSLATEIEADVGLPGQSPLPPPFVASYRVGEPVPPAGRFLAYWRPLRVGAPLPPMALPLTVHDSVTVDLESIYMEAARDNYMA